MDVNQTTAVVGLALGFIALVGTVVGVVRWARPRWRRAKSQGAAALYSLVGRDAIVEPISGREILPALPGIGVRMESVEIAQVKTQKTLEHVAALLESQREQDRRIEHVEDAVADLGERVVTLENQALERVAAKAESVAAWRAVEAIADGGVVRPGDAGAVSDVPADDDAGELE